MKKNLGILLGITFFLFPLQAEAIVMKGTNYNLETDINSFSGKSSGTNKVIEINSNRTSQNLYGGQNYAIQTSSSSSGSIPAPTSTPGASSFTFSVSSSSINFGTLTATNPVSRTTILSVQTGNATGYSVKASQNHPLQDVKTKQVIPDTTCDTGTCNEFKALSWAGSSTSLTYGFGYRCDNLSGSDCVSDFTPQGVYKQFADVSKAEIAQNVMNGTASTSEKKGQITFKVNISATQSPGSYTNTISFVAFPSF